MAKRRFVLRTVRTTIENQYSTPISEFLLDKYHLLTLESSLAVPGAGRKVINNGKCEQDLKQQSGQMIFLHLR
jgi:hypothetical protein